MQPHFRPELHLLGDETEMDSGIPITRLRKLGPVDEQAGGYRIFSQDETPQYLHTNEQLRTVQKGEVIVALIPKRVVPFEESQQPTIISTNYVIIKPSERLDAKFLAWWFNESEEARRQIDVGAQGSALTRLSMGIIEDLKITLPSIKRQRLIGEIYERQTALTELSARRSELFRESSNALLEKAYKEN
ncbi:restriction endonuclease subunit S [Lacticaseibacillus hegangensis]|uniref:Restriction endonuclease subunit S n=1 Tax=Lacticaseibacillus hegangensis TaxID=2486010 RepID=A0ABW4CXY9_9LACO|nr:restriction endonuclease subunit S [Lacticaseibacillus hegangensis]